MSPNVCQVCRFQYLKKGKQVPCDVDFICSKTHNYIYAEDEFMDIGQEEKDVIFLWEQIISLSPIEQITKSKGKEQIVFNLYTLDKINIVFEMTDWKYMSIIKQDALHYLQLFHNTYNRIIME